MIYLLFIIVPSYLFMYILGWSAGVTWTRYGEEDEGQIMDDLIREANNILKQKNLRNQ